VKITIVLTNKELLQNDSKLKGGQTGYLLCLMIHRGSCADLRLLMGKRRANSQTFFFQLTIASDLI